MRLDVAHQYVSASIVELVRDWSRANLATFYAKCTTQGIVIQHIFYSSDDSDCLSVWCVTALFPHSKRHFCLYWSVTRPVKSQIHKTWIRFCNVWMQMWSQMQNRPFAPLVNAKRLVWSMRLNVGASHGSGSKITCWWTMAKLRNQMLTVCMSSAIG